MPDNFVESDHPRAEDGKFGSGGVKHTKKQQDIIDHIKHQINVDIGSSIIEKSSNRNMLTFDASEMDHNDFVNIQRVLNKRQIKLEQNGHNKWAIMLPKTEKADCDDSSDKADSYADTIPDNNPNRPIDAESIETLDDLAIAEKMASGEITGIVATEKCLLVPMRITGTGITERDNNGTKYNIDRPAETFLSDRFLQMCNGLPVAYLHPDDGQGGYTSINYNNWKDYIVGSVFYPYIKETEVWGVAKIFDLSMLDAFNEGILSTSPFVTSQNVADGNGDLTERLEDINHVAIVKAGHWDTDKPAIIADNQIQFKEDLMAEDKKPEDENKVDAAGNMAAVEPKPEVRPDAEPVAPVVTEPVAVEKDESAELAALKAQVEKLAAVITTLVASDKAVHAELPEEAEDEDSDKKAEMVNAISEMADSAHSGVKVIKPVDSKNLSSSDYVRRTIKFNKELIDPKYHFLADKVDASNLSIAHDAIGNMKANVEKKSAELYSSASKTKAGTYVPTKNGMEVDAHF